MSAGSDLLTFLPDLHPGTIAPSRHQAAVALLPTLNLPKKLRYFIRSLTWQVPETFEVVTVTSSKENASAIPYNSLDSEQKKFVDEHIFSTFSGKGFFQELHIGFTPRVFLLDIPADTRETLSLETPPATHLIIRVGQGSTVALVEEKKKTPAHTTTAGIEIFQAPNSHVTYIYTQTEKTVAHLQIRNSRLQADASIRWHMNLLGGTHTYNEINSVLAETNASANVLGTYFTTQTEQVHMQYSTQHKLPNTTNNILVHGVGAEASFSNFYGNIYIGREALGTDTHLTESCLLFTQKAKHDTMPILEIDTNDVKATHSAAVTQIDEAYLFYTQSRGIPLEEAKRLILSSFLESIYGQIPVETERKKVKKLIEKKYAALEK